MEKTRCKLNICGVEVTVSGDADRDAAEQIAGAVRARMERVLSTAYAASVEKAAVITAMNLCEELARRDAALRESEEKVRQLEAELHEIGGAEGLRQRLQQAEGKLKIAEAQLRHGYSRRRPRRNRPACRWRCATRSAKTLESRRGLSAFSPRSDRRRVSFSRSMCAARRAHGAGKSKYPYERRKRGACMPR